jgi:hypothetical protein
MPAHSRSKNGVASLAYVAGIHVFDAGQQDVDGRNKSGHDELSGHPRLFGRVIDVRLRGCAIPARSRGRGEMVDARDLKSLGSNFPCRFKSGRPHQAFWPTTSPRGLEGALHF